MSGLLLTFGLKSLSRFSAMPAPQSPPKSLTLPLTEKTGAASPKNSAAFRPRQRGFSPTGSAAFRPRHHFIKSNQNNNLAHIFRPLNPFLNLYICPFAHFSFTLNFLTIIVSLIMIRTFSKKFIFINQDLKIKQCLDLN